MKRAALSVVLLVVGLAAGCVLWVVSVYVLFVAGFSFYALTAGVFLALALWLIAAPPLYLRVRRRNPQSMRYVLPFLAGMLILIVYFCLGEAIGGHYPILPN